MDEKEQSLITRREVIKAGGLLALGLAYTRPMVETVMAKPAFDAYGPSEEPGGNNPGGNCKGDCPDGYSGSNWDCSSIMVTAGCGNGNPVFSITNAGSGNMTGSLPYTTYKKVDGDWVAIGGGSFGPLASGQFVNIPVNQCGNVRLTAQQHPCHPGNSQPRADISCRPC